MKNSGAVEVRPSIFLKGLRLFIFLGCFVFAAGLGLIALSFLDDAVQYQSRMTEQTNLLIGAGFGLFCGIACCVGLRRLWPARS